MIKSGAVIIAIFAIIGGAYSICVPGYTQVGDTCITVPGLPQRYNWWTSSELCSVALGNLFHVSNRTEWDAINDFLLGLGYTDTYWTGVVSEGHPGLWVIRNTGYELDANAVEWKAGSPSNSDTNLCLAIEYQQDLGRYQWVDYPCSDEFVIVCQFRTCLNNPVRF